MANPLTDSRYVIRRRPFQLWGPTRIYDSAGRLALLAKTRRAAFKDDIRLCAPDETEIAAIRTRRGGVFPGFELSDAKGEFICAFAMKAARSILREEWAILDVDDREVGVVVEASAALALLRRVMPEWLPKRFTIEIDGMPTGDIRRGVSPFWHGTVTVSFTSDWSDLLDRRIGIAAGVLVHVG